MAKKYIKKRVTFSNFLCDMNVDDDEFSLNSNSARLCYNAKNSSGALVQGNGFEEAIFPLTRKFPDRIKKLNYPTETTIKKLWHYAFYNETTNQDDYMLVALFSNNMLYFLDIFAPGRNFSQLSEYVFNTEPTTLSFRIDGKDVIGFVSPNDPLLVWYCEDFPYKVETAPRFLSICYHNNRLFAIEKDNSNLVRYSSKCNPLDWTTSLLETGGGSVEINDYKGQLKNLISLADNLYIFRDFGISKISTYTSKQNYNAVNIYTSSCKIYCSTACVCGSEIYFLAEDGLYYFDGYNVHSTDVKLKNLLKQTNQDNAITCFFNGNLYIACSLNFNDNEVIGAEEEANYKNNSLIEYNIETKSYNISRGVDVNCMLPIKDLFVSKLLFCCNGIMAHKLWQLTNSGKLDTLVLPKKWQGGKINFGTFDKEKVLKEVSLVCSTNCYLIAKSEFGEKTILINANNNLQRVRINLKGRNITITFKSNFDELYISSPQFVFNVEK